MKKLDCIELIPVRPNEVDEAFRVLAKSRAFDVFLAWLCEEYGIVIANVVEGDAIATYGHECKRSVVVSILQRAESALVDKKEEPTSYEISTED